MNQDDLTTPVAAAASTQVKLCPDDEEEPHIWFRLIEAQFAAAWIRSQKLNYANTLANLPKQVFRDILDTLDVCFLTDKLTNDRYLVDTGATLSIVPCNQNSSPSSPLLKETDGQPLPSRGFIQKNCAISRQTFHI
jgi:hypothetical protein